MRLYLDASVLVPLLVSDAHSDPAEALLLSIAPVLVVSDLACAEFASVMARRVRAQDMTADQARSAFSTLDLWTVRSTERAETTPADMRGAEMLVRRLDLALRTPDALHIAIAQRVDASIATFDERMASSARLLGMAVLPA